MVRAAKFYWGYGQRMLRFYWGAKTRYDTHSPFVADLVEHILEDRRQFYPFGAIEALRDRLLADPRHIEVRDHGAGSQMLAPRRRAVADIARVGAVRPREGQQLFKLVHHYRPRYVLELGTSLGLSGLYLAKASRQARVLTLEGCPATAALARAHFAELGADNVEVREGPFQQTLPRALQALPRVDLLYLDGDHRREPTLAYVRACLPKATERSLFVVSDIHWSADMERAWAELRARPEVRLSIDLFDHGLLFFDPAIRHPTHLRLVRSRYKPWRLGLLHCF